MEPIQSSVAKTPSRFAKWSLVVGIVIVLNMFFNYVISLVYPEPVYPVSQPQVVETIYSKEDCISVGGQWTSTPVDIMKSDPQGMHGGYCDPDYTKRIAYDAAHTIYQRNVFIVLMVLGVVSLMLGVFVLQDVLAAALSWGGVLSLLIASMRYWSAADNLVKVLILAIALGGLVWIALRKFGK